MPSAYHQYPRTKTLNLVLIWSGGGFLALGLAGLRTFLLLVGFAGPGLFALAAVVLGIGLWRRSKPWLIIQHDQLIAMPSMFKQRYIDLTPVVKMEQQGRKLLFHTKIGNQLLLDLAFLPAEMQTDAIEKIEERLQALRQAELDAGEPKRSYLDPE